MGFCRWARAETQQFSSAASSKHARGLAFRQFIASWRAIVLPVRSEEKLIAEIETMNADESLHGIVLQLPLPPALSPSFYRIIDSISPSKDVDCLTAIGPTGLTGEQRSPCVSAAIGELIDHYGIDVKGKLAVITGSSFLVGKPVRHFLEQRGARVELCTLHSQFLTRSADVLVCATGTPRLFTREDIKEGAVVFDVGISVVAKGCVQGDVDLEDVFSKVSGITPVPGGVGPVTVAVMLRNLYSCYSALTAGRA